MHRQGFSLVELSIVLVILGLLTGGILTGQNLIRAAELRSVTTEFQNYQTAVMTFRDRYMGLPGDLRNATDFWGAAHATPDTCTTTASTGSETCNGDGDGKVDSHSVGPVSTQSEGYRFWQQLANAGLIEGSYTGIRGTDSIPGSNVPSGKADNSGWTMYDALSGGDTTRYDIHYGNTMHFGSTAGSTTTQSPILTPEEAWNIDTKIDDGKPSSGKIIARYWNNLCAAADDGSHANNDLVASYNLSDTSKRCALMFRELF